MDKFKISEILKALFVGFLVVIATFPENDWSFSIGIDSPLSWAFNYILENGLNMGKRILMISGYGFSRGFKA